MLEDDLPVLEEALELWRERGDARGEALALEATGWAYDTHGDYDAARTAHGASLAVRAAANLPPVEGVLARAGLCHVLVATGATDHAEAAARELLDVASETDTAIMQQLALHFLADCPLIEGDYAEAERRYRKALAYACDFGLRGRATDEVLGVAMALAGHGEAARAVRLAAAAHAEQEAIGKTGDHWWSSMQASLLGAARAALPVDEFEAAERTGRDTPFDEILDELLA